MVGCMISMQEISKIFPSNLSQLPTVKAFPPENRTSSTLSSWLDRQKITDLCGNDVSITSWGNQH